MKSIGLLKTASVIAIAATSGAASLPALAQDGADGGVVDDTIIVTATRRAEGVQDIPLNIAAIGEAQIEEQGFNELADTLAYVPGINVVDRGGRQGNPIIVRGLNAETLGPGDGNNDGGGTVATYLGEIPVFVDLKLNDMQRVEVLLGPQGTLYGAGTLGGAIRYIPNRPDFEGDLFTVRSDIYQYSEADDLSTEFGFTFNKSLADNLAIRGSLDFQDDSGFIDYPLVVREIGVSEPDPDFSDPAARAANLNPLTDVNTEETLSGRLAVRWAPTDRIDGTLTYYRQEADIGGRQVSGLRSGLPVGEYESALRVPEPNEITNQLLALEVTADLGFAELTSASGFSKFEDEGQRDQTDLLITLEFGYELFPTFTAFTREVGREERFNQELRLVSTHDGPFNWIIGGFYNKFELVGSSTEFTPGYSEFLGLTPGADLEYFSEQVEDLTESAIYGEIGYDITDRLSVTVGGRYYEYELDTFFLESFPIGDPDFVPRTLDQIADLELEPNQSDDGFLSKFNISYDLTDDALIYFTRSEGYRIGESNGLADCPAFDPDADQFSCAYGPGEVFNENGDVTQRDEREYGPDTTTNYEIGAKTTLLDGSLTLNGAVYFIEWTDPQLSSATIVAASPITINADGAEAKGVEISADWQATENFRIRGSYSHTEAELTEPVPDLVRTIPAPTEADPNPGFPNAFEDGVAGDRLPGSPEDQFSFFATYNQPLSGSGEIAYNVGYSWQGDVLTSAGGRGGFPTLDSFGVLNGSIVYDAGNWSATLYANNLLDEFYETGVRNNSRFNQVQSGANLRRHYSTVGAPRSIGIRFKWDIWDK